MENKTTDQEMEEIVEKTSKMYPWLTPIILTSYYSRLRQPETLGLRREWVDLDKGIIYLPTTKTLKDPTGRGR